MAASGSTRTWSLMELRSNPGSEDADREFLGRLASTFSEHSMR
jgi:hypothetical protein